MIKNLLDPITREKVLEAMRIAYGGRESIWIDMDGVVVDFEKLASEEAAKMQITTQKYMDNKLYRDVDGFYRDLELIEGAKEAILELDATGKYEINFLSAPSWGNISSFSDKRIWLDRHFGHDFEKRMDLSFHKGSYLGHYLIDDRTKYGVSEFIGEHIHYGTEPFNGWNEILKYFLNK